LETPKRATTFFEVREPSARRAAPPCPFPLGDEDARPFCLCALLRQVRRQCVLGPRRARIRRLRTACERPASGSTRMCRLHPSISKNPGASLVMSAFPPRHDVSESTQSRFAQRFLEASSLFLQRARHRCRALCKFAITVIVAQAPCITWRRRQEEPGCLPSARRRARWNRAPTLARWSERLAWFPPGWSRWRRATADWTAT
jgi:hypothetical protein